MKIILDIDKVSVLRRSGSTDKVLFHLSNGGDVLSAAVGPEKAEVFGNELSLTTDVTNGCGEKIAAALGLKVDVLILPDTGQVIRY